MGSGGRGTGRGEGRGPEAEAAWAWGRDGDPRKRRRSCGGASSGCEWVTRSTPPRGAGTALGLAPSSRVDPQKRGEFSSQQPQRTIATWWRAPELQRRALCLLEATPRGFPRARRRPSFLLDCRTLSLFCRAEGSGGEDELPACRSSPSTEKKRGAAGRGEQSVCQGTLRVGMHL